MTMNRGIKQIMVGTVLLTATAATQAAPPRTLVPVAGPLEQLHGNLKEVRDQSAENSAQARKSLQIAAPKLSERLENLAEAAKRLEKERTRWQSRSPRRKRRKRRKFRIF